MFKPELSTSVELVVGKGLKDGEYRYAVDEKLPETLKELKDLGFKSVELDICGMHYAWAAEQLLKESLEIANSVGMKVGSVHYPYDRTWVDLASTWEADVPEIIKWLIKVFDIAEKFGVGIQVIHPGGMDINDGNYSLLTERFHQSVRALTEQTSSVVCIENMACGRLLDTVDKVEAMLSAAPNANVVLDVNHLLHDKPQDAVRRLGTKIKALHVSDCDLVREMHAMPGQGKIDWQEFIAALEEVGYNGSFNYELYTAKYGYTFADIKNNYEMLFSAYEAKKSK